MPDDRTETIAVFTFRLAVEEERDNKEIWGGSIYPMANSGFSMIGWRNSDE